MERKIGETFEYEGKKLQVKESASSGCDRCFFDEQCLPLRKEVAGECEFEYRTDKKEVIFVEATEQPQEQAEQQTEQPQNINLCEVLKYCPQGETFWSPLLGGVKFHDINQKRNFIVISLESGETWDINADGTITFGNVTSPEVMLFPSKEQRDWAKFKYEKKKELPKTWEEFCEQNDMKKGDCFISEDSEPVVIEMGIGMRDVNFDRNLLPSKQAAEAHLALMQLHQLRDAWREGWVPDWNDGGQNKYVIAYDKGEFEIWQYHTVSRFLAFQDEKRADEFKNFFIDLIRKAGDLI